MLLGLLAYILTRLPRPAELLAPLARLLLPG